MLDESSCYRSARSAGGHKPGGAIGSYRPRRPKWGDIIPLECPHKGAGWRVVTDCRRVSPCPSCVHRPWGQVGGTRCWVDTRVNAVSVMFRVCKVSTGALPVCPTH